MPISLTITIPGTPSAALSPNARVHWAVRNREFQEIKRTAVYATFDALNCERSTQGYDEPFFRIETTIYWEKGRKTMDQDNAGSCCKAIWDGVADALCTNDKRFRVMPVEQRRSGDRAGYVVVTVTEVGE